MRSVFLATVLSIVLASSSSPASAEDPSAPAEDPVAEVLAGLKSDQDPERLAAAERALEIDDDAVTKPLVHLLTDERFEIRSAAARALGARSTEKGRKEAARALCARLPRLAKGDVEAGEARIVVDALHDLAQPSSVKPLLDDVEDSASEELFRARVMAVANVPHADAVDDLIQLLASRGRGRWSGLKRCVVEALRDATGENLGADPDAWRAWWKDARKSFDFDAAARRRTESHEKEQEREERRRDRGSRKKERKGSQGGDRPAGDGE